MLGKCCNHPGNVGKQMLYRCWMLFVHPAKSVVRMLDVQILFGFRTCLERFAEKSARTEPKFCCPFL